MRALKIIGGVLVVILIAVASQGNRKVDESMKGRFDSVKVGMTPKEVDAIMKCPGTGVNRRDLTGEPGAIMIWHSPDDDSFFVEFGPTQNSAEWLVCGKRYLTRKELKERTTKRYAP
jgi:hypothetical protein